MPAVLQSVNLQPLPDSQALSGFGPLAALNSNPYEIGQLQYPLEGLGDTDAPHYMTFSINIPTASKYISGGPNESMPDGKSSSAQISSMLKSNPATANATSGPSADQLAIGGAVTTAMPLVTGDIPGALNNGLGSAAAFSVGGGLETTPKTQRIVSSISLYTPESLQVQYNQTWNSVSLTAALGKLGKFAAAGAGGLTDDLARIGHNIVGLTKKAVNGDDVSMADVQQAVKFNNASGRELAGEVAEQTGVVNNGFTDLVLRSENKALNPKYEMLFQGTPNRDFVFEFDFQPRSQAEAYMIYQIIRTFKAFAAPEYSSEATGRYMIPPATFDIGFFFMNAENLALPRIGSCALTNIAVNYNGSGPFATFNDGFPLHIHLALTFSEIDIITRELIQTYGF